MDNKNDQKNNKQKAKSVAGDIEIKAKLTTVTYTMIICGFLIFVVTYIPDQGTKDGYPVLAAFIDAFRNIALTLFSAGLISALVEVSTITSVVQSALERLVHGNFPFDEFSNDRLLELSKQIAVKRSEKEDFKVEQLEKTVYCLEPELLNDSVGVYYEYHKDSTVIQPDESRHVFQKWVDLEYKLINRFKKPHTIKFCISLVNNSENITGEDIRNYFKMVKFEILYSGEIESNEENMEKKVIEQELGNLVQIEPIKKKPHSTYNYMVSLEYPLENVATCVVKLTYSYEVPMSDPIQSFKLNHPCKKFEHNIYVQKDNWEIAADAYTAFFFTDENKEYQVKQKVPNLVSIVFDNWAVTGAGYMALLYKKKQQENSQQEKTSKPKLFDKIMKYW